MSAFALKCIALACMLCDHVAFFFAAQGVPVWLRWIGRLAAPLFCFALCEGMLHTHSRTGYLRRLYLAAAGMGALMLGLRLAFPAESGYLQFSIFATLFLGGTVVSLMMALQDDALAARILGLTLLLAAFGTVGLQLLLPGWAMAGAAGGCAGLIMAAVLVAWGFCGGHAPHRAQIACAAFLAIQALLGLACIWLAGAGWAPRCAPDLLQLILPNFVLAEGGWPWVLLPAVFYLLRCDRRVQVGGYVLYSLLLFLPWGQLDLAGLAGQFQWMMVFAAPLFLCYDGRRGRSMKWGFYLFYPAHLVALFGLRQLLLSHVL